MLSGIVQIEGSGLGPIMTNDAQLHLPIGTGAWPKQGLVDLYVITKEEHILTSRQLFLRDAEDRAC
jgi:hypothetical protein